MPRKNGFEKVKVRFSDKMQKNKPTKSAQNNQAYKIITETINKKYCEGQFWYRSVKKGEVESKKVKIR